MNDHSLSALLDAVLAGPIAEPTSTVGEFWRAHRARTDSLERAFDRATLGGLHAATVGQAFVAGYRAALQQLVPSLGREPAALCVTEEAGAHPRAIATTLSPLPATNERFVLRGAKRWASVGESSVQLLVVAKQGEQSDGRPALRVARVPSDRVGVEVRSMSEYPVVPDVAHASIAFDAVLVERAELLEGDGYARVVKPFRTVEDIHVFGAILGYLVATGRGGRWPADAVASLAALLVALRALSVEDASAPSTHLALGAVLAHAKTAIAALDEHWESVERVRRDGWLRDCVLLQVASKARKERSLAAARALALAE